MRPGSFVKVRGAAHLYEGRIMGIGRLTLTIDIGDGCSITLRRDAASMNPEQWHLAGIPVEVIALLAEVKQRPPAGFADRLAAIEKRTRRRP